VIRTRTLAVVALGLLAGACVATPTASPATDPAPTSGPVLTPDATPPPTPSPPPPTASPAPTLPVTPAPTPPATPVITPAPTPSATPVVTPAPTPRPSPSGVVVTFRVEAEQFRVLVTRPDLIAHVQGLLAGGEEGRIPNGLIVHGQAGVNEGWSWSIDPDTLEFADMAMEVCDGLPSHVEDGTLPSDRYCPWSAVVVDIRPAP
jgi:hypothetical protein